MKMARNEKLKIRENWARVLCKTSSKIKLNFVKTNSLVLSNMQIKGKLKTCKVKQKKISAAT